MKKSLRFPLAMPGATALCALVVLAAVVGLTGCTTDKHITEVKALAFSYPDNNTPDPNLTVDQALDYRKVCDSVKWKVDMTEQHQTFVEYHCDYKGVDDSMYVARDGGLSASAEDVYQWTYGTNGQPELSYVGFTIHFKNGTSKNYTFNTTRVMELASKNKATNFDEAFSYLNNTPIPLKPALPITDTTYGNTVTSLYPGHSAMDAAVLTYGWIESNLTITGIDELGYPVMSGACQDETRCVVLTGPPDDTRRTEVSMAVLASHLLPVDPKDVEYAVKRGQSKINGSDWQIIKPHSPNKLACLGLICFDILARPVGRAPASIVAKEVGASESAQEASATQAPAATKISQPNDATDSLAAAMASTAMTPPASVPITAPVASTAAASAPTTVAAGASAASSNVPIDDPADLAKMTALAQQAASTSPDDPSTSDGIIDGPFNPSGMNLQAGKPRPDGYPNYAVTCDFKANQCSFVNGMGQSLQDTPEHLYSAAVTVVRNADALPGKYSCNHGLCIDNKGDLVGRISAAMAQTHPELMQ